jgi:3-oxosteroid 1-dehydrogenase
MAEQTKWDHSVDVLVVGSGAGGMTAACRAKDLGADTLMIEKSSRYGGSSAMSGGVIWIANNHLMPASGIKDSDEDGIAYLTTLTEGKVPAARIEAYVKYGKEMLKWLHDKTRLSFSALSVYPDYYCEAPGYKSGSRSLDPTPFDGRLLGDEFDNLRDQHTQLLIFGRYALTTMEVAGVFKQAPGWIKTLGEQMIAYWLDFHQRFRKRNKRSRRTTFGNALSASLRMSMIDRNIPLWLNSGLRELVVDNGRVVGVVADRDGAIVRIEAKKGVILAAGGFESNQQMREKYLPGPTKAQWTAANPSNTGEVIEAGIHIGADTAFMDDAWWGPTCMPPGEETARMLVIEKSLPGNIFVGKDGKRFTDEAAAYIEIVKDMHKAQKAGREVVPAWFIFGKHYRKKYPMGPVLPGNNMPDFAVPKHLWNTFIYKADSVVELAYKIGVNVENLAQTIANMNEYAKTGVDKEYGKGSTEYDRFYGDNEVTPNPCLAPIEAPYYAVQIFPGELGTKGGLKADEFARVLDVKGDTIPGLYAVGNCSGALMGPTYAGAGSTIGPSMTFGWVAANDIMGAKV